MISTRVAFWLWPDREREGAQVVPAQPNDEMPQNLEPVRKAGAALQPLYVLLGLSQVAAACYLGPGWCSFLHARLDTIPGAAAKKQPSQAQAVTCWKAGSSSTCSQAYGFPSAIIQLNWNKPSLTRIRRWIFLVRSRDNRRLSRGLKLPRNDIIHQANPSFLVLVLCHVGMTQTHALEGLRPCCCARRPCASLLVLWFYDANWSSSLFPRLIRLTFIMCKPVSVLSSAVASQKCDVEAVVWSRYF